MAFLSEEMKAQLMKVVGVSKDEFNVLLAKHSPEISKCEENLVRSSPYDIQQILFKNIIETEGLNELNELETIEDKVEWIYSRLMMDQDFRNIRNLLPERKEFKDSIKSKELKEKGNHEFQRKNYQEAIRFYNQSFISASSDKEIALSLANRSVVFFNLKEYSSCIQDCKAALLFEYPLELVYKVHERTARCCVQMGQLEEAKECILQAKLALNKAKLSEERRETVEADLETLLKGLPVEAADHTLTNGVGKEKIKDNSHLTLLSRNKKFPNLSRSVDIKFNPEAGRHAVANSKIQPGEVILEEIPLTWTINPNQTLRTCIRCLKQAGKHMVPSKQRENLFYCSLACYNKATETVDLNMEKMQADDHRLVHLFCSANESSATTMLAFWAIRSQPLDFFVTNESALFEGISPEFGINTPKGWKLEGKEQIYKNLYNLVSHTDSLPENTLLDILITSTVLLRLFQELGYFGQPSLPAKLSSAEKLIGRLLYQFQCGIKFNQHGVYQAENVEAGKNPSLVDVGTSVYPTLLLFNHSCCPNTFRINDGKKIFVIAKHEIHPGDEVTDCYGIHHLSLPRDERQLKLSRSFKFTCTCKACSEDWPLFPALDSNLTQSEMGRLGNHLSLYQKKFKAGSYQEAYTHCQDYLIKLAEIGIVHPHRNYEIAGLALTSCFWKPLEEK